VSLSAPPRIPVDDPAVERSRDPADRDWIEVGRMSPSAITIGTVLVTILLGFIAVVVYGYSLVRLATGSMSPAYPADSVLIVRDVPAASVAVGDVVTVTRDGTIPITHRVVSVDPRGGDWADLVLRGDANTADDPDPYRVQRVGLVVAGVPFGGSALVGLQSPLGLGIATVVVALLMLWAWWPRRERGRHLRS
jgi:signal peptidase